MRDTETLLSFVELDRLQTFRDGLRDDVQYYRSLYNVEQVEILRGPNALLWSGWHRWCYQRVTKEAIVGQQLGSLTSVLIVSVHLILPGT